MAGDEEVEAVADVLAWEFGISEQPSRRIIEASQRAITALDRIRSCPAGGAESGDHEAVSQRYEDFVRRDDELRREVEGALDAAEAALSSPAGGTEPDTAKLVEALTLLREVRPIIANDDLHGRVEAFLAGASVDAGSDR